MRVVALGGGKGLSAALRALRRCGVEPTAIVTVADDGGSSGRLRASRPLIPPGDLRKALVALSDGGQLTQLFGYRFTGDDEIAGHVIGNLMLAGLMETYDDPVAALDAAADLLGAHGRVLPMALEPLEIEADVDFAGRTALVRGQHNIAVSGGVVQHVRLRPAPTACLEAVDAIKQADLVVLGPGSWYTSVIPHLLVPGLRAALEASQARRVVVLNLTGDSETDGLSLAEHLVALRAYAPEFRADVVLADTDATGEPDPVARAAQSLGARLQLAPVADPAGGHRHDWQALAAGLRSVIELA